jgi:carbonic anhydrase/acetyltransferase-like protein (isoleucine patch superfamily)
VSIREFQGKQPEFPNSVYIDSSAVVIGDVIMAEDVSIWPTTVIRGDVHSIRIGAGTNVQDGCVLHVSHAGKYAPEGYPLTIGTGVTIGHRAVVHACSVGDYCLIGAGAVIMDGAVLEDYVILGAGALVPPGKKLLGSFLYVGSPAKQIRPLTEGEKEFLIYSYQHYIHLKDEYLGTSNLHPS